MSDNAKQLAERIADYLFKDGSGREARRLVMEYRDEFAGHGGWGKMGVRDAIERHLGACTQKARPSARPAKRGPKGRGR